MHRAHEHELYLATSSVCYAVSGGGWICNGCFLPNALTGVRVMRHCPLCSYDLCENCFNAGRMSAAPVLVSPHPDEQGERVASGVERSPGVAERHIHCASQPAGANTRYRDCNRIAVACIALGVCWWLVDELRRKASQAQDSRTVSRLGPWLELRAALASRRL